MRKLPWLAMIATILMVYPSIGCDETGDCEGSDCGVPTNYCTYCRTDADCQALYAGSPYALNPRCADDGTCRYDACETDADCRAIMAGQVPEAYSECRAGTWGENYCTTCRNDEDCVDYFAALTSVRNLRCTDDLTCDFDYCETDADCRSLYANTPAAAYTVCVHNDVSNQCSACRNDEDCQAFLDDYPVGTTATCVDSLYCSIPDATCATDTDCRATTGMPAFSECRTAWN